VSARTGYNIDQLKNMTRSMLFETESWDEVAGRQAEERA
jgi:hypothetical protein